MAEEMQVTTPTTEASTESAPATETTESTTSTNDDELSIDEVNEKSDTEDSTAEAKPKETPKEDATQQAAPADAEPFLTIKYNGTAENLSKDDAIALAQKGMNYDKVMQKLNELQNDPIRSALTQQAASAGLSVQEYVDRLSEFQKESSIQRIAEEYKANNPDVTDQVASDYANAVYEAQQLQAQNNARTQQAQSQTNLQNQVQTEITSFMERHPDVKIDETFPTEIIEMVSGGMSLEQAYLSFENSQLRSKLAAAQTNTTNTKKAVGRVSDNAGKVGKSDPFLEGLFGK